MKLSVRLMTYNQENYVSTTLESIFNQQVNFDFEIVVGDDNSTDSTLEIIKDYSIRKAGKIRILERNVKLGRIRNFVDILKHCKGQYVALLDGDDIWIDPYKLQKQVDFLDHNNDYSMCFHDARKIDDEGKFSGNYVHSETPIDLKKKDLLKSNPIPTSSVVFRNRIKHFPEWFLEAPVADWFLHFFNLNEGKIRYLKENMMDYRVHSMGVWSKLTNYNKAINYSKIYNLILNKIELNLEEKKIVQNRIGEHYRSVVKFKVSEGNYRVFNELQFLLINQFPKSIKEFKDLVYILIPHKTLQ